MFQIIPVPNKNDKEIFYKKVGSLIKAHRLKSSVSQEELSKFLGFESRISIANIESGKQKIQLHTIVELAKFLKIPIEQILPADDVKETAAESKLLKKIGKEGINDLHSAEKIKAFIHFSTSKK